MLGELTPTFRTSLDGNLSVKNLVTPAKREQFAAPNFRRLADEDYLVKRNHFVQVSFFLVP